MKNLEKDIRHFSTFITTIFQVKPGDPLVPLSSVLAGNLSPEVVDADPDMAGVDEPGVGGGHGVGSSEVVDQGRVGVSITLAVVVPDMVGESIALGHGVEALGEGVEASAGPEGDGGVDITWVSLGVSLAVVSSGTGDRHVGGVDARSGLEANEVVDVGVVVHAGGGGHKAGNEYLELIIREMLP